ncbi:MAG: aminoacyl-tRNA hydrolase [Nitrospirae bacterium]|nr:aminoacyl-tRNA hydrolase [Nitrospirota bacterium]MBI5695789.1 aminoacyl-tRNA hydrolase [Nitrospirota bacterium]
MKIIVGLGNPGEKYAATRHNLGFMVLDRLASKCRAGFDNRAHRAFVCRCRVAGVDAVLVKPQTFMNLSGEAVAPVIRDAKAGPEDLVVVFDDLDLELGRVRVRKSGGDGGHNGIKSIIEHLDTGNFVRVRLGIGRPEGRQDASEHVLSPFLEEELPVVAEVLDRAVEAVMSVVREGPDRAMNRFNKSAD